MDFQKAFQVCLILIASVTTDHIPPSDVPTFQRGSVEHVAIPTEDDLTSIKSTFMRIVDEYGDRSLPLRSAIESVPELSENTLRLPLRDAVEKRLTPDDIVDVEEVFAKLKSPIRPGILGNYRVQTHIAPYRIDHEYQQLLPPNFKFGSYMKNYYGGNLQSLWHIPIKLPYQEYNSLLMMPKKPKKEEFKVVCYMTNWAFYRKAEGKFVPEQIDESLCTHVVYAFASLDPEQLQIKEFNPWVDIDNGLYKRATSLKNTKVLLSIGGWTGSTGDNFSRLVSDGSARRRFVVKAIAFLRRHGFAGLHFDWNYPICWQSNCKKGPASDKPNFTKLIQELQEEFDKESPPLLLAASISGYKEVLDVAYDLPSLGNALDFITVMTYDYHGAWEGQTGHVSPLYGQSSDKHPQYNTDYTLSYIASKGVPKNKILMGIPFYGQTFTLAKAGTYGEGVDSRGPGDPGEYTKQPGMMAYYEICQKIRRQRWTKISGTRYTGPSAYYKDQWVGYDDVESVKEKGSYIKSKGYGGAVAWTIDLDDFNNQCCMGRFPLLRSLNQALDRIEQTSFVEDCTVPPPPSTPAPPETTTAVDSGDGTWGHNHHTEAGGSPTKKPTSPTTWWSPSTTTTDTQSTTTVASTWWSTSKPSKPSTTSASTWWSSSETTSASTPWWQSSSTTTSERPTTTTSWSVETTTRRRVKPTTTAVTTTEPSTTRKPSTKPPKKCEIGEYLPDPNDCNAFYRCVSGQLQKQSCGGGLHWNREKNICDWPSSANCKDKRPLPYLTCEENVFAAHPEDCTKYMQCQWGKFKILQCAPGLNWNDEMKACDWPQKAHCERKETNEIETELDEEPERPLPPLKPTSPATTASTSSTSQWESKPMSTSKPSTTRPPTTQWTSPSTMKPTSTTQWEWKPPTTSEPGENPWEWHPPIPPTSEKPPLSEPLKPKSDYFKIVCYFTNWAWYRKGIGKYLPEDIDENLCTHIVYGFAVLDFSNLVIKAHDSWADFDNQFYKRVVGYKSKGVKVSIAIGGWNDSQGDKYSRLVNNPAARERFIKNVIQFMEKWKFDGLDLDWEYPKCWQVDCKKGPDSDKPAFSAFVRELKEAFRPKGFLLSSAVSPSKTVIDAGYDVPVLGQYLDWVAVMTYDFHGQWDKQTGHVAPMYYHPEDQVAFFNANFSINYWISEGVPRRKIVMGMPLYGQSFRLENEKENGLNAPAPGPGDAGPYTRAAGFLAYYEICDNIQNKGWTVVQDPERRMGPYAYKGSQWVSFDDREMIKLKSEYIRKMDLGGGMIWALDLDDFKNTCGQGRHPLLTTIRNILADSPNGSEQSEPYKETESPAAKPDRPKPEPEKEPVVAETEPTPHMSSGQVTIMPQAPSSGSSVIEAEEQFKVVCYFTNWAWYRQGRGKYLPSDIDTDLCTHIVYGFAVLDGTNLVIKPHDSWADIDNKFYEKVTALKSKGIKVLIAIGGWNDSAGDKYSRLVNNPRARRRFVEHIVEFIEANNFDGLDLDWEYPKCWQVDCNKGPHSDKPAFAELVQELHAAFAPKGWLLSAAVSPSKRVIDAGYDVPALSRYLSWIAVMTYDFHGQWDKITGHVAPMYAHPDDIDATFNANFSINYWIEEGADRKKIVMGMPMYGQSFSLANNNENGLNSPTYGGGEAGESTMARGFLAYYEICTNILKKDWTIVRDKKGRLGPYAYKGDQWVSFDDIGMIRHKSEYIKAMGLGGGMIWALDLDDFKNECGCEKYPLLKTINRILRNYPEPDPKCVLKTPSGKPMDKPTSKPEHKPTSKPVDKPTHKPVDKPTHKPVDRPTQKPDISEPSEPEIVSLSCNGRIFKPHPENCNQYYLCNQGAYQIQSCPGGLYWNVDHCDWPENTACHPDATTEEPHEAPEVPGETRPTSVRPQTTTEVNVPTDFGEYKVVCYFTNWAWYRQGDGKYLPSDIDPSLCSHINYGFAVLDSDTLTIKPHDSWADIDNEFYTKVTKYRAKGIKVLIAIGGWNDSQGDKYSRLVNNPEARARFIRNVLEFIEKWEFDGLDLDWEYPKCWQVDCNKGPDSDKQGFAALVRELNAAFKPKGLLLSSAVSPSKAVIDAGYDVPSLNKYFDWIAVMTYDFHGHWDKQTGHVAPLYYYPGDLYDYFNANFSLNYWIEQGADPKKLIMGIPLYGQSFSLADASQHGLNEKSYGPGEAGEFTRAGGFLSFYEICERVRNKGWKVKRDPLGRIGPYAFMGNQWVSYDDVSDVKRKAQLIRSLGLGGGMIWALDLDDFRNRCGCGKYPLLKTLNYELKATPSRRMMENCT